MAQCGLAVVFGAFAAHGLKPSLSAYELQVFEKAVRYQFFHGLAMIAVVLIVKQYALQLNKVLSCFGLGSIAFCGSLYCYTLFKIKAFVLITPFGGVLWTIGWLLLFLKLKKIKANTYK